MMCLDTIAEYGLRSLGYGKRGLPKTDIEFCDQVVLVGSGMIWNMYFALIAVVTGFVFATVLALGKNSRFAGIRLPAATFVYFFRGTPLFLQFFFVYELFVLLPKASIDINLIFITITAETRWLTKAWLGATFVLFLNTSAYTAEIFYGALRAVPKGDIEAAQAYGFTGYQRFRKIIWPTTLRLAWPSYTNEAIFLFHSTTLVFPSAFPAWRQKGDALYYAQYFAENTFNPFVSYPIAAVYFILGTLFIIWIFGKANTYLNRHIEPEQRTKFKFKPKYLR